MSVTTVEGIVKDGKIVVPEGSLLPESSIVYVVVPESGRLPRITSPRLADPEDAKFLVKTVEDDIEDKI